ncbi:MAG: hypothetical protein HC886_14540 [Leptolyngbyaceae cyanobacterium SM1_1_3]|nr:hypothetical protein [Leptolyngbyaceae cyanobacterium SM1_1_3]NJN04556.1 hypothetical protein [Leptolyngbyaceae cyanobacterium RM1_1_2]NJO10952.1 hypothetical protein [Leptolyngbyaceae cyanobacterium SL_1_1]
MQTFRQTCKHLGYRLIAAVLLVVVWLQAAPAQAVVQADSSTFIDPNGNDVSAIAKCLPQQLTEGDLQRALDKFGNDYLERVFDLKEDYSEYKISQSEKEFQACLERQGITPVVKQNL